jgi:D-alanine--D-alanine ligase
VTAAALGTKVPKGVWIRMVGATAGGTAAAGALMSEGAANGLLELAGVAYVGSGVLGSAVSMDKAMAKAVLDAADIPQARYRVARAWELDDASGTDLLDDIATDLGFPIFAKPANMGSSVGVSKAVDRSALDSAVDVALAHDEIVVFDPLTTQELSRIVELQVRALSARLADRRITLEVTEAAKEWLALSGYDPAYGARPLRRLVQREIGDRLARALLAGDVRDGSTVVVDRAAADDALVLR